MSRDVKIGVTIEGDNQLEAPLKAAEKQATNTAGRFDRLKKSVTALPDAAGKASASLMLLQNSTSQMGGQVADVANKVIGLAAVMATGGPLGIAIAVLTGLVMAGSVAWEAFTREVENAKRAAKSWSNVVELMNARIQTQVERIKDLAAAYKDFGKTQQQIGIDNLTREISARAKIIQKLEDQIRASTEAYRIGEITITQRFEQENALSNQLVIAVNKQALDKKELSNIQALIVREEKHTGAIKKGTKARKNRILVLAELDEARKNAMQSSIDLIKGELEEAGEGKQVLIGIENDKIAAFQKTQQFKRDFADKTAEYEIAASNRVFNAEQANSRKRSEAITSAFQVIGGIVQNHFQMVLDGTETISEAFTNMALDIMQAILRQVLATSLAKAVEAAIGSAGAVSGVPIIGPVLAIAAATSTLAALMAIRAKIAKPMQFGGILPSGGYDNQIVAMNRKERTLNERETRDWENTQQGREAKAQGLNVSAGFPVGAFESRANTDKHVDTVIIPSILRAIKRGKLASVGIR